MRLQESMLFVPITWRANFCARKFISFVAFEHEKIPNDVERVGVARRARSPAAARRAPRPTSRARSVAAVADERRRQTAFERLRHLGSSRLDIHRQDRSQEVRDKVNRSTG